MRGVDKRKPALSGLLVAHECVDQKAGHDWHQPIQHAAYVPDAGVETTPLRHIGAQAAAELFNPAVLSLRVLAGYPPGAGKQAAQPPISRGPPETSLHSHRNPGVY